MTSLRPLALALAAGVLLASGLVALRSMQRPGPGGELPALPLDPEPALELLELVPFTLDQPAVHRFRLERPLYDAGFLLALRVPAELTVPRQTYEPVLCAGAETLERLNHGGPEGVVVALLPAARDAAGAPEVDWSRTPVWYAAPELPERVDAAWLERELARARDAGMVPFRPEQLSLARAAGGTALALPTRVDLNATVADLVERHSPGEVDLVRGLRVPVTR